MSDVGAPGGSRPGGPMRERQGGGTPDANSSRVMTAAVPRLPSAALGFPWFSRPQTASYSASVTCSPHSVSPSVRDRWVMK